MMGNGWIKEEFHIMKLWIYNEVHLGSWRYDENGNPLKPTESGSKEPGTVSGYEYVKTVTDPNGNIKHIFKKVEMPTPRPVEPSQPATPKYVEGQKELPNTGTKDMQA